MVDTLAWSEGCLHQTRPTDRLLSRSRYDVPVAAKRCERCRNLARKGKKLCGPCAQKLKQKRAFKLEVTLSSNQDLERAQSLIQAS